MKKLDSLINSYNQAASTYAVRFGQKSKNDVELRFFQSFINLITPRGTILDAGCGPGHNSQFLHDRGFQLIGADLSMGMLKVAQSNFRGPIWLQADLRHLPLPKKSIDGILAAYSLIHLPQADIVPALQQFHGLLRNKGVLFLSLQEGTEKGQQRNLPGSNYPVVYNCYTAEEMGSFLNEAGFVIIDSIIRRADKGELPHDKLYIIAKAK